MKTIIAIALCSITGCLAYPELEEIVPDNRTHEQKVSDNCLKYFEKPCNEKQREMVEADLIQEQRDIQRELDAYIANIDSDNATRANNRLINNQLLQMRIEQQNRFNQLKRQSK